MHAKTFPLALPPSANVICMMESLFHSEKLFQVHILCQRTRTEGGKLKGKANTSKIIYLNFKSSIFAVCAR